MSRTDLGAILTLIYGIGIINLKMRLPFQQML